MTEFSLDRDRTERWKSLHEGGDVFRRNEWVGDLLAYTRLLEDVAESLSTLDYQLVSDEGDHTLVMQTRRHALVAWKLA